MFFTEKKQRAVMSKQCERPRPWQATDLPDFLKKGNLAAQRASLPKPLRTTHNVLEGVLCDTAVFCDRAGISTQSKLWDLERCSLGSSVDIHT